MPKKNTLDSAKMARNDEFYTRIEDIVAEVDDYKHFFKDKVVYCNCDDPVQSKFYQFFRLKFEPYGCKKLITTCYKSRNSDLFSTHESEQSFARIYDGEREREREEILTGDGDFRSKECLEYLKQADIVVTNPPFSLFREYLPLLIKYQKKFIILGHMNAFKYKEIFPYFQNNKCWYGHSITSGDRWFQMPEHLFDNRPGTKVIEGKSYTRVMGVRWFTNLVHNERRKFVDLFAKYNKKDYPKYDNYDAIEVSKTKLIPKNYDGVMGVPISFIDKYNPEQFEVLGVTDRNKNNPFKVKIYTEVDSENYNDLNGSCTIRQADGTLKSLYTRLLIRRKQ